MATTLTLEQMKQFVRDHFEDFVNKRNAAVIRKNMTSDFLDHDGPGGKPTNLTGDEQMMAGMYKVMPDLHLTSSLVRTSCMSKGLAGLRPSLGPQEQIKLLVQRTSLNGFWGFVRHGKMTLPYERRHP